jgi:hypothetical protein
MSGAWRRCLPAAAAASSAAEKRVVGGMIGAAELQGATSDLAKSVRALYRDFLRASARDPGVRDAARDAFRKDMHASGVQRIDFLLRQGHKKLALIKSPGFKGVSRIDAKK